MARLIRLTAAHAGPTNAKVWINADKIVKLEGEVNGQKIGGTRIHHEPYDAETQSLDYTDVEETPEAIAHAAHEAVEIYANCEIGGESFMRVRQT